ncbi:hypothetical protein ACWD3J_14140 [Streptomyces sp. NPDC002755]
MTQPTARERFASELGFVGDPQIEDMLQAVLDEHAHQLAEGLRREADVGDKSGLTRIYYRASADRIDPKAADDPLTVLRAVEDLPHYRTTAGCPHCPDGHTPPDHGQTWSAWVADVRDSDGQPMQIIVARSAGAHVAESDAQWIRKQLNDPT